MTCQLRAAIKKMLPIVAAAFYDEHTAKLIQGAGYCNRAQALAGREWGKAEAAGQPRQAHRDGGRTCTSCSSGATSSSGCCRRLAPVTERCFFEIISRLTNMGYL